MLWELTLSCFLSYFQCSVHLAPSVPHASKWHCSNFSCLCIRNEWSRFRPCHKLDTCISFWSVYPLFLQNNIQAAWSPKDVEKENEKVLIFVWKGVMYVLCEWADTCAMGVGARHVVGVHLSTMMIHEPRFVWDNKTIYENIADDCLHDFLHFEWNRMTQPYSSLPLQGTYKITQPALMLQWYSRSQGHM